jgi:type I restriction enzyme S subunit
VSKIDARYGAFGIAPDEVDGAIITGNFWAYDVDFSKLNIEWFNQFTNSPDFYNLCERASAGITHRKYLNETFFLNYEIMLPSVEEQLIQIEKIKKQKVSFGELTSELTHQLDLIKQLRQAFLREAMQGKLVKSTNIKETGQQLLSKIKAEKAQLIAVKKLKKEKELPPITEDEIPFEIPENWAWCRLGEISSIVRGGSPRPAGDPKYYDGDIPFLKVGDLTGYEGKYCNTYTHTIKKEGLYKTRYVEANTLMLTNSGATLGVPRICTFPTTFNDGIAAFLGIDNLNKEFLFYFLREKSDYFLKEASRGQGQPNLNTDIIGSTLIPLPPLHEQEQIVTKLEELMAFCDGLEQSIKESQGYNEKLLQQVLREVLKGNSIVNE